MSALAPALLWPLLLAALAPLGRNARWPICLLPLAPLPAAWLALAGSGVESLSWPWVLVGSTLGMDDLRRTFLALAGVLWLVAGGFAVRERRDDPHRCRFAACWLLALAGNVGLILALDAVTFYSAFAVMTFAAYGLIIHRQDAEANKAGRVYLVMALVGEGFLLSGLLGIVWAAGGNPMLSELSLSLSLAMADAAGGTWIVTLLFLGFAVKAGVALVHMWLPLAHPVAPTPASAVLSGVMIKAGVLGWLVMLPLGGSAWPGPGQLAVVLGMLGSLGGGLIGLVQTSPKVVLAYSSVSQMGILTVLTGVMLQHPHAAAVLMPMVALYGLHHGLAKGALFLAVGSFAGSRRLRAALLVIAALPALALAGLPFTSGGAAKLAVKEALAASAAATPALELFLTLAAVVTTLLMVRFLVLLWRRDAGPVADGVLLGWWRLAVLCSMLVFWWLPARVSAVPLWHSHGFPMDMDDARTLLLPILLGAAIGAVVMWVCRHRRLPGLSRWGAESLIPPGDILGPIRCWGGTALKGALGALERISRQTEAGARRLTAAFLRGCQRLGQPERIEPALRRNAALWFIMALILLSGLVALAPGAPG